MTLFGSSATMRRISASAAARLALRLADVVEQRQRAETVGRQFQHVEAQPFGGLRRALAMCLDGALHQRNEMADRLRRRQMKAACCSSARREGRCRKGIGRRPECP